MPLLNSFETRVLGSLIEKQITTPDQYPLSLNALRLACNQTTNRDPVVEYDERMIKAALDRMAHREWTRFASGASSRALKYRHLLDQALGLTDAELAVLAVLMLRGAQTPGELKQRTERLHKFESPDELVQTLDGLAGRELVARLDRRPGQKEDRYLQLLGGAQEEQPSVSEPRPTPAVSPDVEARLSALEAAVEDLRARLDA